MLVLITLDLLDVVEREGDVQRDGQAVDRGPAEVQVEALALVLLLGRMLLVLVGVGILVRKRTALLAPPRALDEEIPLTDLADARSGGLEYRIAGQADRARGSRLGGGCEDQGCRRERRSPCGSRCLAGWLFAGSTTGP